MAELVHRKHDWHLSAEEFCRDSTAVEELAAFLATGTGQKLKRVLQGEHPLNQAARVKNLDPQEAFREAMKEQQNPQGILGFQRGYQAVCSLLTETLTRPLTVSAPASRKSSRRMAPHPASLP